MIDIDADHARSRWLVHGCCIRFYFLPGRCRVKNERPRCVAGPRRTGSVKGRNGVVVVGRRTTMRTMGKREIRERRGNAAPLTCNIVITRSEALSPYRLFHILFTARPRKPTSHGDLVVLSGEQRRSVHPTNRKGSNAR